MKHTYLLTILLLIVTSSSNCKKSSLLGDKLPPATQEGKNTCGFLLNGEVWLPKGDNGYPNLICDYDETYNGGSFNIGGYRYDTQSRSAFSVSGRNITSPGTYKLNLTSSHRTYFSIDNTQNYCVYYWEDTIANHNAYLTITKLDKTTRIVSGIFEFAQVKQGCQEVRITQGRFDMKY